WLITPDRWGNSFNIILLNKSGPQNIGKQSIGTNTNPHAEGGQGKFSPSGDHFAWYHPKNGLFLYKFNRENGVLSHFEHFDIPFANFIIGGCEFSPNGRFLYVSHDTSLFQLDLLDENIQSRLVRIADFDGFGDPLPTAFFFMERTPDNKIIVNAINGSQYLHVIQEPNKKGLACHFEQHSIMLPTINNFTLPHFPNYRLGALSDPTCDSLNVIVDNPLANFNISIFPNPATDWIYISNGEQVETFSWIYFIYNLNGQLLKVSDENVIDVRDFAEGLYLLRILGKNAPSNTIQFIKTSLN
ncbi:MAG: T9SS type A sorting domain-containing protein, partial [Saprospiraceae bacterium]